MKRPRRYSRMEAKAVMERLWRHYMTSAAVQDMEGQPEEAARERELAAVAKRAAGMLENRSPLVVFAALREFSRGETEGELQEARVEEVLGYGIAILEGRKAPP